MRSARTRRRVLADPVAEDPTDLEFFVDDGIGALAPCRAEADDQGTGTPVSSPGAGTGRADRLLPPRRANFRGDRIART